MRRVLAPGIRGIVSSALAVLGVIAPQSGAAQTPEWIWHGSTNPPVNAETSIYFRKTFRTPAYLWNARLTISADDKAEAYLNGVSVARCESWDEPVRAEVSVRLNQGENVLGIRVQNQRGPAGLLVHLNLGGETNIVSDDSWLATGRYEPGWNGLSFNAAHWNHADKLGPPGIEPWGDVFLRARATPAGALKVAKGFKVELLRSAAPEEGSWVCMAFDDRGRLIISPEGDLRPLLRLSFKDGRVSTAEPVPAPVRFAMGLLHTHGRLFANARGPHGPGLYSLKDANGNDLFDTEELALLRNFDGAGEHGYHAVRLGPDERLYIVNGNGTKPPAGLSPDSPHRNFAQDVLSLNPDETTEVDAKAAV